MTEDVEVGVNDCRVYWGSHGCDLVRGHEGHHVCCCECEDHEANGGMFVDEDGYEVQCVGAYPYYGDITEFYGEDVPK